MALLQHHLTLLTKHFHTELQWHTSLIKTFESISLDKSAESSLDKEAMPASLDRRKRPYDHFLVVAIGRGVGLGIIANGDLYRGAFGGAGEFGHTAVTTEGRFCNCGIRGCLETYVSFPGIVKNYREYVQVTAYASGTGMQEPALLDIVERARNGDDAAKAAMQRAGTLLGVSLANLVNIFNPQCIVLSSPNSNILTDDLLVGPMHQEIKQHLFSQMGKDLRFFTVEQLGYESWARGAGSLVLRHFLVSPARVRSERELV
jgi:predicted NBD/HSP70 family sugar kinase